MLVRWECDICLFVKAYGYAIGNIAVPKRKRKKKKGLFTDLRAAFSNILGQDQNVECFFHSEKQSHFAWVMTAHFFPYGWVLFIGWGWQFSRDFVVDEFYLWQQLRKVKLGNIQKEILGLLKNGNQPL